MNDNMQTQLSIRDLTSIEIQVRKSITSTLDRSDQVFVTPTLLNSELIDYDGIKFSRKYLDLLTLILVTWYSNYFNGFEGYVRYEIEQYLNNKLIFPELNASLTSKEIVISVLFNFSKVHNTNILFGTILRPGNIERVLRQVHLKFIHYHKPKELVRRRGYKDKGSKRPTEKWIESSDWSFNEAQNEIENSRAHYRQEVTFIVNAIGGRLLSDGYFISERSQ